MEGSNVVLLGPMRGGKSTELYRRIGQYADRKKRVLLINSRLGIRQESDGVQVVRSCSSHSKAFMGLHPDIEVMTVDKLEEVDNEIDRFDAIGIDEFQFYQDADPVSIVWKWCRVFKKFVITAGLNGNSDQEKFGKILDLIPCATDVVFLPALCEICDRDGMAIGKVRHIDAPYTIRRDHAPAMVEPGASSYMCVCLEHLQIHSPRTTS